MIINKKTGYIFEKPEAILSMPSHMTESFKKLEGISEDYIFFVPAIIIDDHSKAIYKVGFLRKFYRALFKDVPYSKVYKIINDEWQVFKSERQMERLCKKYIKLFETKEEI